MAGIKLNKMSKVYQGNIKAVNQVEFEIKDKEFVVFVGPSGCGKSTLLRMIAGLEEISSGELFIDDKLVNDLPPKDRDISIVFQNYALYPHMTAYENLAFGMKIRKVKKKEIRSRVLDVAKILEIEDLLDRKPKTMSGGQRQRVAIGRAIVRNPKVFLFDEPLSNLDAKLRVQMRIEIAKLHKKLQTTIVYVTHDQVEAMTLGDRIVVLNRGEVQQIDTPENIYHKPNNLFVARFIGTPPMNTIDGIFTKSTDGIEFSDDSKKLKVNLGYEDKFKEYINKEVVLGIRPEDIYIQPNDKVKNYITLNCKIEFTERTGHEIYAYFQINDRQLIARLEISSPVAHGNEINLYFDTDKMFFFDKKSENIL